jgi:WD40 repeat protein
MKRHVLTAALLTVLTTCWTAHAGYLHPSGLMLSGTSVAVSSDGSFLVSAGFMTSDPSYAIVVKDANTNDILRAFGRANKIALSPDDRYIASSAMSGTSWTLWNVESGEKIREVEGHKLYIQCLTFTPDGKQLLTASWDPESEVRLWDVETGELLRTFCGHEGLILALVVSPDGQYVASAGGGPDCEIRYWDIETGECLKIFKGHRWPVRSLAFDSSGERLASGSNDCEIRIWNIESGEKTDHLTGHLSPVMSLDFSPDGSRLLSGSGSISGGFNEAVAKLWDIESGECEHTFPRVSWVVTHVEFQAEDRKLFLLDGYHRPHVYDMPNSLRQNDVPCEVEEVK